MKILVTGAAGFIGYYVAQRFLRDGDEVVGLDNLNPYYNPALKRARLALLQESPEAGRFTLAEINLGDAAAVADLFSRHHFDIVVHVAAQASVRYSLKHPQAYVESNLAGFVNILEGCRHGNAGHLVYASSSSVYGLNTTMPFAVSDNVDHPISLYAATKKANELMAHTYSHLFHLPTTGLRFFNVYGPWGRPDMAPMLFSKAIVTGQPIQLFNNGKMRRSFTYIDDVVEGVVRVARQPAQPNPKWDGLAPDPSSSSAPYRLYNIGHREPDELFTFVSLLEKAWDKKAIIEFAPLQPGDVLANAADTQALEDAVGFKPTTPLAEGLEKLVTWYRANLDLCLAS